MDKSMKQNSNEVRDKGTQRRAFFGQVLLAIGGGFAGSSLLQRLFRSGKTADDEKQPMKISINPLAVPRTKEGSKSNG
jgi:hypothetical protein